MTKIEWWTGVFNLSSALIGFASGLFSFFCGIKIDDLGLRQWLRIWWIGKKLNYAIKWQHNEVRGLNYAYQIAKLYSRGICDQMTAIAYLGTLGGDEAFEVLAQRLSKKPELCVGAYPLIVSTIKQIAKVL
jgi:hypothetical protein